MTHLLFFKVILNLWGKGWNLSLYSFFTFAAVLESYSHFFNMSSLTKEVKWVWNDVRESKNDRIFILCELSLFTPLNFFCCSSQKGEEINENKGQNEKNLQKPVWIDTYEYWFDSFLPMSGQLIFCRSIRMIQMNRIKFICC